MLLADDSFCKNVLSHIQSRLGYLGGSVVVTFYHCRLRSGMMLLKWRWHLY